MQINFRQEMIKEYLTKNNYATVNYLSDFLSVSKVTIRKDLQHLENLGIVSRKHGGVELKNKIENRNDLNVDISNLEEKEIIANLAYKTISDGDSIFIGSGTSCLALARKLKNTKDVSLVTNSISVLLELVPHIDKIFLIGGELVYYNNMIHSSSEMVTDYLNGIYVKKAFSSAIGLSPLAGLTVNNMASSYIYKSIPSITENWNILAHHSKFYKVGLYQVASIDNINTIITDKLDDKIKKDFSSPNLTIIAP